jgi:hypothetical protein
MGYTHYWTCKATRGQARKIEAAYQRAIKECNTVIRFAKKHECNLSGYNAHMKANEYGGIKLNGVGDDAHEDFTMREHFNQNISPFFLYQFCKTARKPYDIVVVACLCILKDRLGDAIEVSSDGDASDWIDGAALARLVLKRRIDVPQEIMNEALRRDMGQI